MVQRVRQTALPRLEKDARLPFFSRCLTCSHRPLLKGLFFALASGDKHG